MSMSEKEFNAPLVNHEHVDTLLNDTFKQWKNQNRPFVKLVWHCVDIKNNWAALQKPN